MHYLKEYKKESDGYEQQQEPWKHVSDGDEGRGNRTDGRHKHTQRDRHVHVDDIQVLGEAVHDPSQRSRVEVGHGRVQHALDEVVVEGTSGEVTSGGETKRGDHGEENCGGEDNSMTDDVMTSWKYLQCGESTDGRWIPYIKGQHLRDLVFPFDLA